MKDLPKDFIIDPSRIVCLEKLTSMECYAHPDGSIVRRALESVSFTAAAGQRFALLGDDVFELRLLSEIIGNIKPYESGKCSLVGLGMTRDKQRILQHVYYLNGQDLLYLHMQGISYLMFSSRKVVKNDIDRQLMWLNRLLEFKLEHLCFTYIRNLSRAERMLLSLLPALDTKAVLLVVDLSDITVPESLTESFVMLFQRLTEEKGKTIVFSTAQRSFADRCATHAALLIDGSVRPEYTGSREELCSKLDKRLYLLRTENNAGALDILASSFPGLRLTDRNGLISVYGEKTGAPLPSQIHSSLESAGVLARELQISAPSLDEAMEEAVRNAV